MRAVVVVLFVLLLGGITVFARAASADFDAAISNYNHLIVGALISSLIALAMLSVLLMFFGFEEEVKDELINEPERAIVLTRAHLFDGPNLEGLFVED